MKSGISDSGSSSRASAISWSLAQTTWVGGLWIWVFLIVPAAGHAGLAPLLVAELVGRISALVIGMTILCLIVQVLALLQSARCLTVLWRDTRGQILVVALLLTASYGVTANLWPGNDYWLRFSTLMIACCGLILVLQPVPGGGPTVQR